MVEGAPHMAMGSMINLCVYGVTPGHVYKGGRRRRPALEVARQVWGVLLGLPSPSRIPLFLSEVGEKKEGKREGVGNGRGGAPFPLVQFGPMGGACGLPCGPSLLSTKSHEGSILPLANSRNSLVLRKIPEPLRTFLMSEYSLPIYRSLRLNHFETPRHVRDLIQDYEQTSVHQIT